eukprot:gnl/TRDRNA2_/TRDRNA2_123018_c2_seq1.p2 gnl/TRDRNA2_/TRDRNA2_123018_c2~~gnl/TRDRNA2_/TRDRNA2_123018_c2_seq1.p2  ORF type:complete len:106 (-),score=11.66 gnl/TRDRNA2_/TRDRNA2_123018_c2_seq1:182-499(-)
MRQIGWYLDERSDVESALFAKGAYEATDAKVSRSVGGNAKLPLCLHGERMVSGTWRDRLGTLALESALAIESRGRRFCAAPWDDTLVRTNKRVYRMELDMLASMP